MNGWMGYESLDILDIAAVAAPDTMGLPVQSGLVGH
jgi:hypothetical protein